MDACRLNVIGASGSGTTTLGRALASHWSVPHADADDYFWVPTEVPYTVKREVPERLRLMHEIFVGRDSWVLSGSVASWGESLVETFDAVVFVSVDNDVRMRRLQDREAKRYGGMIAADHQDFLDWAAAYEDPSFQGRSRVQHEAWLAELPCPVLRLDSALAVDDLVRRIVGWRPA